MMHITHASIAYIVTQVCMSVFHAHAMLNPEKVHFCLSLSPVFSKSDNVTDSEHFYTIILDLLEDPDEAKEVDDLLRWWDR
jgi:hypothetical protein